MPNQLHYRYVAIVPGLQTFVFLSSLAACAQKESFALKEPQVTIADVDSVHWPLGDVTACDDEVSGTMPGYVIEEGGSLNLIGTVSWGGDSLSGDWTATASTYTQLDTQAATFDFDGPGNDILSSTPYTFQPSDPATSVRVRLWATASISNDGSDQQDFGSASVCVFTCKGGTDDGRMHTYYADRDGDFYGNPDDTVFDCSPPAGYTVDDTDCDDTNAAVNPWAVETCNGVDDNCDGTIDEGVKTTYYADADGDNYGDSDSMIEDCSAPAGFVADATDCDDTAAPVNPGELEICDGFDNNCDSTVDEGVKTTYYADTDGDNYGDSDSMIEDCSAPAGYVADATDCDDTTAAVNPGELEICDGIDNNCDGTIDEGVKTTYYADTDGDNYGDTDSMIEDCSAPVGYVADATDCDDSDVTIYPGATELCNGIDDDCDSTVPIDEIDADGDGYLACAECDDTVATTYPGATELCNGVDDDCDGVIPIDEVDADGDGFLACEDCNDGDATIYPGAVELCNSFDDDCDGMIPIDEVDADGDGYLACEDCDDSDANINSGAVELCNGTDGDCDGVIDRGGNIFCLSTADIFIYEENATISDFGFLIKGNSDINGDGVNDMLVASPTDDFYSTDGGRVFGFYGSILSSMTSADANFEISSTLINAELGIGLDFAGDINSDASADLVVGEPGSESVYIYYGPLTGDYSTSDADILIYYSGSYGDGVGTSVAGLGDQNGDGNDDLLIGNTYYRNSDTEWHRGEGLLVNGPISIDLDLYLDAIILSGGEDKDFCGTYVGTPGDLNGDGLPDLMLTGGHQYYGVPTNSYIEFGPINSNVDLVSADVTISKGPSELSTAPFAGDMDIDGSGGMDLIIGMPGRNPAWGINGYGAVYIFYDPLTSMINYSDADADIQGEGSEENAGNSVTNVGDINLDGYDDILFGVPGYSVGVGAAALFFGPLYGSYLLSDADYIFVGDYADAGRSVSGLGDINGDGYPDFAVGEPGEITYSSGRGMVYIVYGSSL